MGAGGGGGRRSRGRHQRQPAHRGPGRDHRADHPRAGEGRAAAHGRRQGQERREGLPGGGRSARRHRSWRSQLAQGGRRAAGRRQGPRARTSRSIGTEKTARSTTWPRPAPRGRSPAPAGDPSMGSVRRSDDQVTSTPPAPGASVKPGAAFESRDHRHRGPSPPGPLFVALCGRALRRRIAFLPDAVARSAGAGAMVAGRPVRAPAVPRGFGPSTRSRHALLRPRRAWRRFHRRRFADPLGAVTGSQRQDHHQGDGGGAILAVAVRP